MPIYKRFAAVLIIFVILVAILISRSGENIKSSRIWGKLPQKVGLGEWVLDDDEDVYKPEFEAMRQAAFNSVTLSELQPDHNDETHLLGSSKFAPGAVKPVGSKYTKGVVMGKVSTENVTWLDQAALPTEVQPYVYGIDEPSSLLRPPRNKGREAMVYLSYIIDHYDKLPDVSIFLHPHRDAWHNNELLNHDAIEMITRLSSERVTREGYMNLRCSWIPGCPEWIQPGAVIPNKERPEEEPMAEAWASLFPGDPIPKVIGSACCAQFAVSRDRIRSIPLQKFEHYRDWLLHTSLPDGLSGRVFEYLWAKIFTNEATYCPDQRVCYCDGYGVCFEDEKTFDYWFELRFKQLEVLNKLAKWQKQEEWLIRERNKWGSLESKNLVIPPVDEDTRLKKEYHKFRNEMETMRLEALRAGVDPELRANIAGRPWKEGDGY